MLLPLLLALSAQFAPSLDVPGIILLRSGDTIYLSPTKSIDREGPIRRATLVEINLAAAGSWEIMRRDSVVELNCAEERIRILATQDFGHGDNRQGSPQPAPGGWTALDPTDFPRGIMSIITCSDANLDVISHKSLEGEVHRLRRKRP